MELKFEEQIVVFIDILGFRSLVEKSARGDEETRARLAFALSEIANLRKRTRGENFRQQEDEAGCEHLFSHAQVFSDSVILATQPDATAMNILFHELSRLFVLLMRKGIYIRGGVAVDTMSTNGSPAPCGPAVNAAYDIESKIADSPRIVCAASAVKFIEEHAPEIKGFLVHPNKEDGVWALKAIENGVQHFVKDKEAFGTDVNGHLNGNLHALVDRPREYKKIRALAQEWSDYCNPAKPCSPFEGDYRTGDYLDIIKQLSVV